MILPICSRYILWCMQCSHETGRAFAVMFFGVASSYRVFLDLFDEQDGLRSLYNSISVLKILQVDDESSLMTDDEEATQKQVNISTVSSIMCYHLWIKWFSSNLNRPCDKLRCPSEGTSSRTSSYAASSSPKSVTARYSPAILLPHRLPRPQRQHRHLQ